MANHNSRQLFNDCEERSDEAGPAWASGHDRDCFVAALLAMTWVLPPNGALRLYVQRVHRLACRHEQTVALAAAEADIGTTFRQQNTPDQVAVRCEHRNAVMLWAAGLAAPDVALRVAADTVGEARRIIKEQAAVCQPGTVGDHVIDPCG